MVGFYGSNPTWQIGVRIISVSATEHPSPSTVALNLTDASRLAPGKLANRVTIHHQRYSMSTSRVLPNTTIWDGVRRIKNKWKYKLGLRSEDSSPTTRTGPTFLGRLARGVSAASLPTMAGAGLHASAPDGQINGLQPTSSMLNLPIERTPQRLQPSPNLGTVNAQTVHEKAKKVIWPGIKKVLSVLESSVDAFGPLNMAISGLKDFIETYDGMAEAHEGYQALRQRLEKLLQDLGEYMDEHSSMSLRMTTSVGRLCIGITNELELVEKELERSELRPLAVAIDQSNKIMECYRRVQEHLERLILNANMEILKSVNEQEMERRLEKMSAVLLAVYNSSQSHDLNRGPCNEGTRKTQIKLLLEWAQSSESGKLLWMSGMAGTGKTTIAYTICKKLQEQDKLGASFFCSARSKDNCQDINYIIPSIAYQLARYSFPFKCALLRILSSEPDVHVLDLSIQWQKLLVGPLREVQRSLPTDFIVVVDALDECKNKDSIGLMLDLFLTAPLDLPIRILVSSRPEKEIRTRIQKLGNAQLDLHDQDSCEVASDIEAYMKEELMGVPISQMQWEGLLGRCGVFIEASTSVRFIKGGYEMKTHEEAIETILESSKSVSGTDFKTIDQLYSTILTGEFENPSISEANKGRIKKILHTIICAARPMTLAILADLLSLDGTEISEEQVEALLQPLRSIVHISNEYRLVTTPHTSFPEFMLSESRSGIFEFHCDEASCHNFLARACLLRIQGARKQLGFPEAGGSPEINFGNLDDLNPGQIQVLQELQQKTFGLLSGEGGGEGIEDDQTFIYAANSWHLHLRKAPRDENLIQLFDILTSDAEAELRMMVLGPCACATGVSDSDFGLIVKWCQENAVPEAVTESFRNAHSAADGYGRLWTGINNDTCMII
ncbi:unnamed protein product [Rhizoctonia solani]|uniref:NACHT domain-containing protein n=1 Tax=Rhizoctonia solani TaxID=456999 RepID=A0A8H2Y0X1_9AGAM|nr:unnamed protein product [Rhizoctonia solani]